MKLIMATLKGLGKSIIFVFLDIFILYEMMFLIHKLKDRTVQKSC